jgi:hypothetical protein
MEGGSRVCILLNLVLYPKRVDFASLTFITEYWASGWSMPPEPDHNYNLDSITLNDPCPVSRLRVVSHNKIKCRENENCEQNYFLSIMHMQIYNTSFGSQMGTGPPPPHGV